MRVLLILISFLLVGCAKEPTYLKCDKTFSDVKEDSDDRGYWIVLDHQNSLWITSRQKQQNQELNVYVNTLRTDGTAYWGGMEQRSSYTRTLSRTTLKYRDSSSTYQCEITDDLSYLRDVGVEKARIKI